MLENHIEDIKKNEYLILRLPLVSPKDMVVIGDYTQEYWIQGPEDLWDDETEICTVQELIECLKSEKQ